MANRTLEILLQLRGDAQALSGIANVGRAGRQMGADIKAGGAEAKAALEQGAQGAKAYGAEVQGAGQKQGMLVDQSGRLRDVNGRFVAMKDAANQAGGAVGGIGTQAQGALGGVNRLLAATVALTGVGMGLSRLGGKINFVDQASIDKVNGFAATTTRLKSILNQQGRLGDAEGIQKSAKEIAVRGNFAGSKDLVEIAARGAAFEVSTQHMAQFMEMTARQARTLKQDTAQVAQA